MSTFCVKCGKSEELVRGDGATFARNTMAIEVKESWRAATLRDRSLRAGRSGQNGRRHMLRSSFWGPLTVIVLGVAGFAFVWGVF